MVCDIIPTGDIPAKRETGEVVDSDGEMLDVSSMLQIRKRRGWDN
jgi:hypothetical protein